MTDRGQGQDRTMAPGWYPDPDRPGIEIYWDGQEFSEGVAPRQASKSSSMVTRLAIALGALFLIGAVAATFLPTSSSGTGCGTWVSRSYDRDEIAEDVTSGEQTADDLEALGGDATELRGLGHALVRAVIECDDKLSTRRTASLSMLGLAVLLPGAVIFVAGKRN